MLEPPHRASRFFEHNYKMRSIHPDAFGILRRRDKTLPFFLEWERRAVRPGTMAERLAPYLRYYSSHDPTDDHGAYPVVLIIWEPARLPDSTRSASRSWSSARFVPTSSTALPTLSTYLAVALRHLPTSAGFGV